MNLGKLSTSKLRAALLPNGSEKGIKLIDQNRCVLLNCKRCFVLVFFATARRIVFHISPELSLLA